MKITKITSKIVSLVALGIMLLTATAFAADARIEAGDRTIYVGDTFGIMDGVIAFNAKDKIITDQVGSKGKVNTGVAGTYKITYFLVDNPDVSKKITVTVKEIPERIVDKVRDAVLTVSNKTIRCGSAFNPLYGIKATDDGGQGADITSKVKVTGVVNTGRAGKYTLTYEVTGENGNTVTKAITITVC